MAKGATRSHSTPPAFAASALVELCDRAPDAIGVIDRPADQGDYLLSYVNRAFEKLYRCDRSRIIGTSAQEFMRPRSLPRDHLRVNEALLHDDPFRIRRDLLLDDVVRSIEINFQLIPWEGGRRWMFITRDVTRERERHIRMVQLTAAVEHGFDGVCISNREAGLWVVQYVNDAFTRMTGYRRDEVIGNNWSLLITDARKLEDLRAALRSGQQVRTELPMCRKDGSEGVFELSIQPVDESDGAPASIVALLRDVSEVRRREATLAYEARHDPLTGLDNRRSFERALETAIDITRGRPAHALLFADLDEFKSVNDQLGHEAGDRVLKIAANAFKRTLFDTDVLARWGGDEFVALLFHCSLENAVENAHRMIRTFLESTEREGTSVSIGVVPVLGGESVQEAMQRVDAACYRAKAAGRGRVHSEPEPRD